MNKAAYRAWLPMIKRMRRGMNFVIGEIIEFGHWLSGFFFHYMMSSENLRTRKITYLEFQFFFKIFIINVFRNCIFNGYNCVHFLTRDFYFIFQSEFLVCSDKKKKLYFPHSHIHVYWKKGQKICGTLEFLRNELRKMEFKKKNELCRMKNIFFSWVGDVYS